MIRVKICGINDAAGRDAAVAAAANWIGVVFFPPSPRAVTPQQAAGLLAPVPSVAQGGPRRVGLFVDPTAEAIEAALDAMPLDALQLYGRIADGHIADLAALRARFGVPVWRAVGVSGAADLPARADGADALVLEAKPPPSATRPGGNAAQFDWTVLRGWRAPVPWLLAGGLTPVNVADAIRLTGACAVDVSSGVERSPGVKDAALIRAFVSNARAAQAGVPA